MFKIMIVYTGKRQPQKLTGGFESMSDACRWLYMTYSPDADFWAGVHRVEIVHE